MTESVASRVREREIDLESASAAFLAIISLTCSGSVLATVMRSKEQTEKKSERKVDGRFSWM